MAILGLMLLLACLVVICLEVKDDYETEEEQHEYED